MRRGILQCVLIAAMLRRMTNVNRKLLIVQAAALSRPLDVSGLNFAETRSVCPAVTCTVQASFRTASHASAHGMIANGRFFRPLRKAMFWEQSAGLVQGERIWSHFRDRGRRVGMMFWQQSLGESADWVLSPAPIHKHHGGMIDDCYCRPADLYPKLCKRLGRRFKLHHYWGPLARADVGDWIAQATAAVMTDEQLAPDLLLSYLPTLDYDLQRYGPDDPRCDAAYAAVERQLETLLAAADEADYDMLVFGDYAMTAARRCVFPNRVLREAGLLKIRNVRGMIYADLYDSDAFALVDHEAAHVYCHNADVVDRALEALAGLEGVEAVLDREAQANCKLDHANSGEFVLLSEEGCWFAYPWWAERERAPDFASHVDIHNKPGFDPCELFGRPWSWPPFAIPQDVSRVGGTHGRADKTRPVVWACTREVDSGPADLVELAGIVKEWLNA
jgi:predicted AlkP superfamily pyrophosphatase or phosphodiesterase